MRLQFQALIDALSEQKEVYTRILEVLATEKTYLILADINSLIENNKLKDALLGKSRALEKIRQLRVEELLKVLGQIPKDKSISELIPLLPSQEAKQLIEIQAKLSPVLSELKSANLANEKFAHNARNAIENGLKAIKGEGSDNQTYKKQGTLDSAKSAGKLVSKEI